MKYIELKNDIKEGARGVYLFEGDDAYFRENGVKQVKDAFLSMPELNFASFDGETLKGGAIQDLVSALESFPFMSEKRIVKVSEFYPSESEYEKFLKPLFADFPASSVLLIVNSQSKKGVDLKRRGGVTYVDCNRADGETVAKWAYITLKRAGYPADAAACDAIAAYCLNDMARVSVEVEKLINYAPEKTLTRADVDELVYKDADYRIYEMTNAVARRDFDKFCEIRRDLVKKAGDEITVINGLFNYFKNLLSILQSKADDYELSALLKMKEYGVKKSREQARAIGRKKLEIYVEKLYAAASGVKCGEITPQSALSGCENYIFFGGGQ